MVLRRMQERAKGRAERSDGRAFDPLDVGDEMPRVVITVDTGTTHQDGSYPVHIDYFNMPGENDADRAERVDELLTLASKTWIRSKALGSVATSDSQRSKRGKR